MRMTRIALAAAAAVATVAAVAIPGSSDAASASRGVSYFASTARSGGVAIRFSRDGRQIVDSNVAYRMKCSDNDTWTDWDGFKAIPVSATGAFRSSFDTGDDRADDGGVVHWTGRISGRRNSTRTQVTGTYQLTYAYTPAGGAKVTCDTGKMSFTARD